MALAEMKSSIPAQLTELLDLEMNGLSFDYVLNFSENIRSGQSQEGSKVHLRGLESNPVILRDAFDYWRSSCVVRNCRKCHFKPLVRGAEKDKVREFLSSHTRHDS